MKFSIRYILIICVLSFNALVLKPQSVFYKKTLPDFSGTWILDHSKSDAEFKDFQITCLITQTVKTFTVEQILVMKNGEKSSMPAVTYDLDGKEVISEEQEGKSNLLVQWATPDQKSLIVKYKRNISGNSVGSITEYKLSEHNEFLSIKSTDLKGDSPMVQVYKKK